MTIWRWIRDRLVWLADVAYAPFACAAAWSLFAIGGIPITHDGLGVERLETYRRAYLGGNLFPMWTPFASAGHGSPYPVLYHRLHGQVFGLFAIFIGSLTAMKLSVVLLLMVGAAGMRCLCLAQGVRGWVAWTSGLVFLTSNYVWCDWFVRGAIAEFTAFMLVPWFLHFAIRTFDERLHPFWGGLSAVVLFYAHMMTFFFLAFMVLAIIVTRLVRMRRFGWSRQRETWKRAIVYGLVVGIGIAPFAAASQYAIQFSQIQTLAMRNDNDAYFTWTACVLDPNFTWLKSLHPGEPTAEIGRWPLLFIVAAMIADGPARRSIWTRTHGMLVPALVFFLLQDKRFAFVFDLIPGAAKIQFPCRLLTLIVPVVVLCFGIAIERALRSAAPAARWVGALSPIAALAQLNLVTAAQRNVHDKNYEQGRVEVAMYNQDVTQPSLEVYGSWDLFLPPGMRTVSRTPFLAASPGCTISSHALTKDVPQSSVVDEVDCRSLELVVHGSQCSVHFSQFLTPLLQIDLSRDGLVHADQDGTTVIDAPIDGTVVRIRQISWTNIMSKWLVFKLRHAP